MLLAAPLPCVLPPPSPPCAPGQHPIRYLNAPSPPSAGIINPARALGPAIAFGGIAGGTVALYLAAQFAGAALAATLTSVMSD